MDDGRPVGMEVEHALGGIQGDGQPLGPVQLLCQGRAAPRLAQEVVKGAAGAVLCTQACGGHGRGGQCDRGGGQMAGAGWGAKVRAEQDRGPERGVGATLLPHPPVTTQAGSRQTPMKRMMLGCRIATIKPDRKSVV